MMILEDIKKSFLIDPIKKDVEAEFLNGALIGGWTDLTRLDEIAEQYRKCADVLVDHVSTQREFAYEYAYPIYFMYRHYLEIRLKSLFGSESKKPSHSFDSLLNDLLEFCREKKVPIWLQNALKNRINDFKIIDPKSTRFRYGTKEIGEEFVVDLQQMKSVFTEFEVVISELEKIK